MKVIIKLEVSDEMRRAIRFHNSRHGGMATRENVRNLALGLLDADLQNIIEEYRNDPDRRKRAARKLHNLGHSLGMKPKVVAFKD